MTKPDRLCRFILFLSALVFLALLLVLALPMDAQVSSGANLL
jgi:hypothetical protein